VNVSMKDGAWLFSRPGWATRSRQGTERKLQNGNGWTDWNMSWEQYVKGSARRTSRPPRSRRGPTGEPETAPTA
jgi:hypothetical protein